MKQEVRPFREEAARKFAVKVTMTVYTPTEMEMAINKLGSQPGTEAICWGA
jgi:hypothetical protein